MTSVAGDNHSDRTLAPAELKDMVGRYHHRLLSLEAELKDQARSIRMSPREFAKRVNQLKSVQRGLAVLQKMCMTATPVHHVGNDIGLPILDDCTPAEKAVCERFLEDREDQIDAQALEAARIYKWLTEAVSGRTGWLRMTLRLSKLRRALQSAERDIETATERAKEIARQADKFLKGRASGAQILEGLMTLFNQLDGTISRVARLRAGVRRETQRVRDMEAWLRQEERKIRDRPVVSPPPTPLTLAQAEAAAVGPGPTFRRAVRRKKVAEEFWQDVVHNGARAPTDKEIRRAAAILHSPRARER